MAASRLAEGTRLASLNVDGSDARRCAMSGGLPSWLWLESGAPMLWRQQNQAPHERRRHFYLEGISHPTALRSASRTAGCSSDSVGLGSCGGARSRRESWPLVVRHSVMYPVSWRIRDTVCVSTCLEVVGTRGVGVCGGGLRTLPQLSCDARRAFAGGRERCGSRDRLNDDRSSDAGESRSARGRGPS